MNQGKLTELYIKIRLIEDKTAELLDEVKAVEEVFKEMIIKKVDDG